MNPNDIRPPRPSLPPRSPRSQPDPPPRKFAFPSQHRPPAPISQAASPAPVSQPQAPTPPAIPEPPAQPVPAKPKRPKAKKRIIWVGIGAALALIIVGLIAFIALTNSHATEKKLGSEYIMAVQTSNYDKLGNLIYPPIKDVMERLGANKQANITKNEGYKSILTKSGQTDMVGNNKPKQAKLVSLSSGGGAKHAVLTYKVGDNFVSVIVVYDSAGKPHVLTMKEGNNAIDNDAFKAEYDAINNDIKLTNTLLDQTNIPSTSNTGQQNSGVEINQQP